MKLVLNEEQIMLKDMAEGFLTQSAPVDQLRKLRDEGNPDGFDRATWAAMAEMGWAGVLTPEEHGGVGLGLVEAGVLAEQMGRTLTASPFMSTAVLGATAINGFGTDEQKAEWLPGMAAGEKITAVAVDEGRKHQPFAVATTAERSGNGFRLNGKKSFVMDAHIADALVISARTSGNPGDEDGITLFIVPRDADGVTVNKLNMVDSRNTARVNLENVDVTAGAVLGEVDGGAKALRKMLNAGRAVLAAEMSGSAQETFGRSVEYMKERKQFGALIGSFQSLQHRAAHLYSEMEMAKSLILKSLMALDADVPEAQELTHAAKAKIGQIAQLATQEGVQWHGGIGMTDDVDIGFFMKRVRVAEAYLGDSNYHMNEFARLRGY
ncbi:MAG: acyl-CoA dehydrogenase family protein [Pikeienuella sp.]